MAEGTTELTGVLDSADVRATIEAVRALGAHVDLERADGRLARRNGARAGARSGRASTARAIDCGNSGTTARLLMGVLAGWPIEVTLVGDESLSRRPMRRVTSPLTLMGAAFSRPRDGHAAGHRARLRRARGHRLRFAGRIRAGQDARSCSPACGRRVARASPSPRPAETTPSACFPTFGVPVDVDPSHAHGGRRGPASFRAPSRASPCRGTRHRLRSSWRPRCSCPAARCACPGVSLNPTRTGFLRVLERMGASHPRRAVPRGRERACRRDRRRYTSHLDRRRP